MIDVKHNQVGMAIEKGAEVDNIVAIVQVRTTSKRQPDNNHITRNEGYAKSIREERDTVNF